MSRDCSSRKDYSKELPRVNRKDWKSVLLRNVNRIHVNQNRLLNMLKSRFVRERLQFDALYCFKIYVEKRIRMLVFAWNVVLITGHIGV